MENEKLIMFGAAEKPYNIRYRCFHFAKEIIKSESESKYKRIHFLIFGQLIRSATSIGANVIEGSSGSTKKDFANFFHISLKSAHEARYRLCLTRDTIEVNKTRLDEFLKEADEISKIIAAILLSTKQF
ncbi:MAG: four helix bundle protein [Flavisolibacter sp.]|nr:four helix bundle protein [Flavisolibacter sp.]